ncbi:HAD-IIA family hydrolase [Bacillus horti]|uniref:Acid sugar phosphatase n=1 Tax=Caldalkalibacillus horti TaxID=77523 RepID=A0ABT9VZU7_9BACI|nr:HAD-IIA family hydrolase [Bacillus horti]MDQ0166399.1 arabinose operon protein AraL [Bacillus horti]
MLQKYKAYIFDLDGTIYLGETVIAGALEVVQALQKQGKKILFLTNKTIESRQKYVEKLNHFGMNITEEQVLSPTYTTMQYLREKKLDQLPLYIIGEDLIKEEFRQSGFHLAQTPQETKVVIVSWDRSFRYEHIDFAYQAVRHGALTIATNPDRTCPIPGGEIPDCGSMIGALEGATGKGIDFIIGKPSVYTLQVATQVLGVEETACLMIGDRLETDILMGAHSGMDTALVLTGVTKQEDILRSGIQPTYVFTSISDLLQPIRKINKPSV